MQFKSRLIGRVAILTLFLTFVLVGVVLAASVTVDTFNEAGQDLTANSGTTTNSGTADDASILGTERDIVVNYISGGGNVVARVDNSNSNLFSFSQDSGVSGNATLVWDGNDNNATSLSATGLGGADLVSSPANDGFLLTIVSNDLTMNLILRVYTNATNFSNRTIALPGNITTGERVDMLFPFSSFTVGGGAGATFTNVGAVELLVNSGSSADRDVSIDLLQTSLGREYGDLPDAYNLTLLTDNGARHIPQGLRLGVNSDLEADGVESATATGDDSASSPDDEDGVVRSGVWSVGTDGGAVEVTVNGCPVATCRLNGWIDWNNDNDFGDTSEQIFTNLIVGNGVNSDLTFTIPTGTTFPNTFSARFRVCQTNTGTTGCNSLTGETTNGEVEDYRWSFSPTAVTMNSASTGLADSGGPLVATLAMVLLVGASVVIARRKH
jgi:hypothetical protein